MGKEALEATGRPEARLVVLKMDIINTIAKAGTYLVVNKTVSVGSRPILSTR